MNLLLLTKFFPYGTGEAFLENEIDILSKNYDKIIIIACDVSKNIANIKRTLPNNIVSYYVPTVSKYRDTIFGIRNFFKKKEEINREMTQTKNLISKIFLCYFEEKSQRIFKYIIKKRLIKEILKSDFVLYSYWLFITARVGLLIKSQFNPIYCFSRAHRYDLYEEENSINYLPYRTLFLKEYNNIFTCSEHGTKYLKKKYHILARNVMTSYLGTIDHGINPVYFSDVCNIISCSRVEPVKRLNKIIDALEILDKKSIKIEWTHVGDGSDLNKIKKLCKNKLNYVKYDFKGNLKNSDVIQLYKEKQFDVFINVSSSEGLPVSIMEAISFGIPVIASDVGGVSEIVVNNVTGYLIEKDCNALNLANKIEDYINKDVSTLKKSCRSFWNNKFRAELQYGNLQRIIKKHISSM